MRILSFLLKLLAGLAVFVLVVAVGAVFALNTSSFQNKLMSYATEMLSQQLGTEVTVDKVYVNVFGQKLDLYGLHVEDQQRREMLKLEELSVKMDLMALSRNEVQIYKAGIKGVHALLVKSDSDSIANYQFLVDSIKNLTAKKPHQKVKKSPKKKLAINVKEVTLEDINVRFNDKAFHLGHLIYNKKKSETFPHDIQIGEVSAQLKAKTKKGPLDLSIFLGSLHLYEDDGVKMLNLDSIRFQTCNHKPRRNHGRPKRGFFDSKNLDLKANFHFRLDLLEKDSVRATLVKGEAFDKVAGLDFRDIRFAVAANKRKLNLTNVTVQQGPATQVHFAIAQVQLPNKKEGREFSYFTSEIRGSTQLRDISRPFAPVLKHFKLPLYLTCRMSGDQNDMHFRQVEVYTADKRIRIGAIGDITNLRDKHKLLVNFKVHKMYAMKGAAEKVVNQFVVKKLMMKPLDNLGNISYTGGFAVPWKKEHFWGTLNTQAGGVKFDFLIDELTKYIDGRVQTDSLMLGKVFDQPKIGKMIAEATFKVDISKPRTAKMRKIKGGKLPIGKVNAFIKEVKYKSLHIRNLSADIISDGALAEGRINVKGKYMDVLCTFTYICTDKEEKVKAKPGIRFHKLSEEDRKEMEEKKLQKKLVKEEKKRQKAEEKEARRIQKDQEKAIKQQLKAEKKALKDSLKADRKAAKAAEKALRKQQKEAEKAARKKQKESEL